MIQETPTPVRASMLRLLAQELEEQEAAYYRSVAENEYLRMVIEDLKAERHQGCSCEATGSPPRLRTVSREG